MESLNFLLSIAESLGCHKSTPGKYWEIYHGWKKHKSPTILAEKNKPESQLGGRQASVLFIKWIHTEKQISNQIFYFSDDKDQMAMENGVLSNGKLFLQIAIF